MTEEFHRLHVPLCAQGEEDLDYGRDTDTYRTLYLTEEECGKLEPLFDAYNAKFGIIIDYYEEETIPTKDVDTALAMATTALEKSDDTTEQHGLRKLIEALQLAQKHSTFVLAEL